MEPIHAQNTHNSRRFALGTGAIITGTGVALGAFGAHALKQQISPEMLTIYHTGVQYQLIQGLATMILACAGELIPAPKVILITRLWISGVILFSGSLYALSISGIKVLGAITPLGGVCFLTGWVMLSIAALKKS
ncbi:MAG: DUF423 domain-containing protein [Chthonomonadales bacterium]